MFVHGNFAELVDFHNDNAEESSDDSDQEPLVWRRLNIIVSCT